MNAYFEHLSRVVEIDKRFKHAMAIALNPATNYREGIIRCITSRSGDPGIHGTIDQSELRKVTGDSLEHFEIGERLKIKNEDKIVSQLAGRNGDFIGLEDPDIWIDDHTGLTHIYFTIPILGKDIGSDVAIHLGHAVGKDMDSLKMTEPALRGIAGTEQSAKEVSIAPVSKNGFRYNLIESYAMRPEGGYGYSTVRVAVAEDMGKPWQYGETVFHPAQHNIPWIAEHASPGPLLPKDFLDVGESKLVGFINGREMGHEENGVKKHGMFSVGLFIYDYEHGKIDWVSPEPFIRDSEAKTVTFASQFVEQGKGSGILYAHVDDSFVRAYTIEAEKIKPLLP